MFDFFLLFLLLLISLLSSAERCLIEAFIGTHFKTRMVQVGIKGLQANQIKGLAELEVIFSVVH